jgi:hypothetical protein
MGLRITLSIGYNLVLLKSNDNTPVNQSKN